jgi:integrase
MPNTEASLVRVCKTERGWRRYPVVFNDNGRVKHEWVHVGAEQQRFSTGYYKVRFYRADQPQYDDISTDRKQRNDPRLALNALKEKLNRLDVAARAAQLGINIPAEQIRASEPSLQALYDKYLDQRKHQQPPLSDSTIGAVRRGPGRFVEVARSNGKHYTSQLESIDIDRWVQDVEGRGCSARTRADLYQAVKAFLDHLEIADKLVSKEDSRRWRKYVKKKPRVYHPDALECFFDGCDPQERVTCNFFQGSGFRRDEVRFLPWENLDLVDGTASVTEVTKIINGRVFHFRPKDSEERTVPLPKGLVEDMKRWKAAHPGTIFVFSTSKRTPYGKNHFNEMVKQIARRGRVECGRCDNCCLPGEERWVKNQTDQKRRHRKPYLRGCSDWHLHKFRATYATFWLRSGRSIKDVQELMGHSSLESTMRYLSDRRR